MIIFKKYIVLISCCTSIFFLASCASTKIKKSELKENSNEFIEALMVQKSSEAVDAQQSYAMIVAENRDQKNQKQNLFDNELVDIVDFIGKPNVLLKALSNRYGYEFNEVGTNKILPTITVDIKKQSPLEVLKMIGYQIDKVADLVLDKDARVIRLVYRNR